MKKIVTTVVSWDDMFLAEGREVPADGTVTLSYNGTAAELDLTDRNRDELEQALLPYIRAGRRVTAGVRGARTGPRPGTRYPPGTRAAKQAMREWADEQARLHPELAVHYDYISPGSRAAIKVNPKARPIYYYKDRLKRDYAAHLARLEQHGSTGPLREAPSGG